MLWTRSSREPFVGGWSANRKLSRNGLPGNHTQRSILKCSVTVLRRRDKVRTCVEVSACCTTAPEQEYFRPNIAYCLRSILCH
jgi:hypothetical protein